jgi:uncharacterized protein YndB with AHSA1/START domain
VFRAWTDAQALARWWAPRGCWIKVYQVDLRPDGIFFHYSMRRPDGVETFAYREIAAPERIVFVNSLADEKGGTARSPYHPKRPLEIRNTLTLTEHEGKTTLNLRGGPDQRDLQCSWNDGLGRAVSAGWAVARTHPAAKNVSGKRAQT